MFILGIPQISIRSNALLFLMIMSLLLTSIAMGQDIQILKTSGMAAVISEGSAVGIERGDLLAVKRYRDGSWKEITYAEVTHVRYNMARIQVVESAPQVELKLGDVVEKLKLRSEKVKPVSSPKTDKSSSLSETHQPQKNFKSLYLGPTAGAFIPLGDMKDVYETNIGYGGILGFRFRSDLDVSLRFFYTAKSNEWSFWNIQFLGRRYFSNSFLLDFGYGICYPEFSVGSTAFSGGGETIRLGFIGGFGFVFPVALTTQFEIGCLFHYYPNFGDISGQFMTIQGRLIL